MTTSSQRTTRWWRSRAFLWLSLGLLAGPLIGCERSTVVQPDAQLVLVSATTSEVRADPAIVHAGDVYLVLDDLTDSIIFVERKHAADETAGPMGDDDLARLAQGDTFGTSMGGFDVVGCDSAGRAEDRGQLKIPGSCGNVFKVTLRAGRYAIIKEDPTVRHGPTPMAVLEVLP